MIKNLIVIPYRNRKKHLDKFISSTIRLLTNELIDCKVLVIEQTEGNLFNRGALINIGYDLFKDKAEFIITHDVDLYPTQECISKFYSKSFDGALGICCSPCNTLGGIVKIPMHHFKTANGFPNNFWGWGVEDKAFQNRIEFSNLKIKKSILRNRGDFTKYFKSDESDHSRKKDSWKYNTKHKLHYEKWNKLSSKRRKNLISFSGINNLKYKIIENRNTENYDHFLVEIEKNPESLRSILINKISAFNPFD
jgi:hypothetical protein